jgi:hypothetical protein
MTMQPLELADLLDKQPIDPKTVLVLRHRPKEPELRRVLPQLASEKPKIYNAYQQTQTPRVEKAMTRAKYVASFIGHKPGKALFVGLYEKRGEARRLTKDTYWQEPGNIELRKLAKLEYDEKRPFVLWFDLKLTKICAEWKGKLVVGWPGKELSWWRWADKNKFEIQAILEKDVLTEAQMPPWRRLVLTWGELMTTPETWQAKLKEWRGVYFIFDVSDGKGYVGSAYGSENLYHRWCVDYAQSGHGNNKHLKLRDPTNFRFSILQRVSPDMSEKNVTRLEHTWMKRLHTQQPFGLND